MLCSTLIALALAASSQDGGGWTSPPLIDAPVAERALPPPPMVEADAAAPDAQRPRWAAMAEAGVPDGAAVGFAWDPVSFVRFSAAALTNGSAVGARAGVALRASGWPFRPSIGVDVGHVFEGDAQLALAVAGAKLGPLLGKVTYDFATASLGADLGSDRVAFLVRLGASYVDVRVPDAARFLSEASGEEITGAPIRIRLLHPSARLGLLVALD